MTKKKRAFIRILTRLRTVSLAKWSAVLPLALPTVFLNFSPLNMAQAAERDSLQAVLFPRQEYSSDVALGDANVVHCDANVALYDAGVEHAGWTFGLNVGIPFFNRLLGSLAAGSRFQAVLSPVVYGQFFNATIYDKVGDAKFSDGTTKPKTFSLGWGGALSLRYRILPAWSLQLKNSVAWITDNKFDGITTLHDHSRQNALWLPQIGILWKLK